MSLTLNVMMGWIDLIIYVVRKNGATSKLKRGCAELNIYGDAVSHRHCRIDHRLAYMLWVSDRRYVIIYRPHLSFTSSVYVCMYYISMFLSFRSRRSLSE